MNNIHYNFLDKILIQAEEFLNTNFSKRIASSVNPAHEMKENTLKESEKQKSAALMRVNHSGEVCAQALYQGQLCAAHSDKTRKLLQKACEEEIDHLAWTSERIHELNGHRSYLNSFWYVNSFIIGFMAGLAGDRISLGFVEETERQVAKHLENHLSLLPKQDEKSRIILERMREDETQHGFSAANAGASSLPNFIKFLMAAHAKIMTTVAYWI